MQRYERFGECLKRCLQEGAMSASEAARLVGFRSRNSIFRILSGDTSDEVNLRFLSSLHDALGEQWPEERWLALQEALSVDRLGVNKYRAYRAFGRVLFKREEPGELLVSHLTLEGMNQEYTMKQVVDVISQAQKAEIVITGCCDSRLARMLAERCRKAGEEGRLYIRHYIDTSEATVTQNILGILPLVSKPWYNARLVEHGSCPEEMAAIYRLQAIYADAQDETGAEAGGMFLKYDEDHYASRMIAHGINAAIGLLDRWRFQLELLKPMPRYDEGPQAFVAYTEHYLMLEKDCTICSIKPDVHFNCIPAEQLEQAILEGFEQTGMASGPELVMLIAELKRVHEERYRNMMDKHKPTHLVYSLPAMECFMRTGVQTDHFFIQRAYTVEERRVIISNMLEAMRSQPWFNVYFLKESAPELHNEITFYDGKGVLMMDAYTGYDLESEHSEALISLPAFMESFRSYFMEEILVHHVTSRAETISCLERLLVMNVQE